MIVLRKLDFTADNQNYRYRVSIMKNKLLITILSCILFACTGCSADNSGGGVSDDILSDDHASISDPQAESLPPDIPQVLSFESFEQIAELNSVAIEDEETVAEYLNQKGFSINGLETKNDVAEMFERIGSLNMLHLDTSSGYKLTGVSYYVTYDYIMSTYRSGDDIVRFICYIGSADEQTSSSDDSTENDFVGKIRIGAASVGLRKVTNTNSPFALFGRIETANSRISILLSEDDEAEIENSIGTNIILTTLTDLISD